MAQTFAVEYNIIVNSEQATQAIANFQQAAMKLDELSTRFTALTRSIGRVNGALVAISKNMPVIRIDTAPAQKSINRLANELKVLGKAVSVKATMDATQATTTMDNIVAGMALMSTPQSIKFTANAHNVFATIRGIRRAIKTMTEASALPYFIDGMAGIGTTMGNIEKAGKYLNKHTISPKANVGKALESLNLLAQKLNEIKSNSNITITATAAGSSAAANTLLAGPGGKSQGGGKSSTPKQPQGALSKPYNTRQALGPTYINSGGTVVGSMLKSMGIMYGITSIFSSINDAFNDAIDYENISQTTKNILKTHDRRRNFEQEFVKMEKTIREVGMETKFTAPEVASAGKFLAMAGLNTSDISNAIRPIANIALVGDNDLGETADVVTNIMTGFEIPSKQMNNVADILTMTFTKTNTTLMELAESFKYASTVANQAGLSFEQTSAAFGVLGNAGIKGSSAGTTLRMMLNNMLNPTKKQQEAWDTLGISTKDEAGNLRNFTDIMLDLHEKSKQMGSGEFTSTFYKAFRITAATGALALVRNAETLQDVENANTYDSYGLADDLAEQKKMTVQGLWMQMTSAFTEAGMKSFEKLQNAVRGLLIDIIDVFKTTEFIDGLSSAMHTFLEILKGVLSIAGQLGKLWADTPQWLKSAAVIFVQIQMTLSVISGISKSILGVFTLLNSRMIVGFLGGITKAVLGMNQLLTSSKVLLALTSRQGIVSVGKSLFSGVAGNAAATATTTAATSYMMSGTASVVGAAQAAPKVNIFTALGGLAKALFTTPVGLAITGGTALYGIISHLIEAKKETDALTASTKKWLDTYRTRGVDGKNVKDDMDLMLGHFRSMNSYLKDEGERLKLNAKYWHDYWIEKNGLNVGKEEDSGKAVVDYNTEASNRFKNFVENFEPTWLGDPLAPLIYSDENPTGVFRRDQDGFLSGFGIKIAPNRSGITNASNAPRIEMLLAQYAADPSNSRFQKYEGYMLSNILKAVDLENLQQIVETAWNWSYLSMVPDKDKYYPQDADDLKSMTQAQLEKNPIYIKVVNHELGNLKKQWDAAVVTVLQQHLNGEGVSWQNSQTLLTHYFGRVFDPVFGQFGTKSWQAKINEMLHDPKKYDMGDNTQEALDNITKQINLMLDAYDGASSKIKELLAPYLYLDWFGGLYGANNQNPFSDRGIGAGSKPGEKRKINGVEHVWKFDTITNTGYWFDPLTGKQLVPKSSTSFLDDSLSNAGLGLNNNDNNDNDNNNPYGSNTDESEYKSRYNSSSAAPKQIIVKIENLMRVDSQTIDMTDDRQVAAVENIKQELATALLDVVQDFNANI